MNYFQEINGYVPSIHEIAGFIMAFGNTSNAFEISRAITEQYLHTLPQWFSDEDFEEWSSQIFQHIQYADEMFDLDLDFMENEPLPF